MAITLPTRPGTAPPITPIGLAELSSAFPCSDPSIERKIVKKFLTAIAVAVLGVGVLVGCSSDHGSPEANFAQMMIPHHEQAMVMSDLALSNNAGPEVSALAIKIQSAQGPEIAQMRAMLDRFGEEEAHSHGDHDMPGMLTEAQLDALGAAKGSDFDALFLAGMIEHHEGAIVMAEEVLGQTDDSEVRELAEQIIEAQRTEIAEMLSLLDAK
jgi:uncharacterized protein (DUF305 family)